MINKGTVRDLVSVVLLWTIICIMAYILNSGCDNLRGPTGLDGKDGSGNSMLDSEIYTLPMDAYSSEKDGVVYREVYGSWRLKALPKWYVIDYGIISVELSANDGYNWSEAQMPWQKWAGGRYILLRDYGKIYRGNLIKVMVNYEIK